jgi:hypothetical protein
VEISQGEPFEGTTARSSWVLKKDIPILGKIIMEVDIKLSPSMDGHWLETERHFNQEEIRKWH